MWPSTDAIEALPRSIDRFEPSLDPAERERLYGGWREAVARAMYRPS
jgi:glycerol kinase